MRLVDIIDFSKMDKEKVIQLAESYFQLLMEMKREIHINPSDTAPVITPTVPSVPGYTGNWPSYLPYVGDPPGIRGTTTCGTAKLSEATNNTQETQQCNH